MCRTFIIVCSSGLSPVVVDVALLQCAQYASDVASISKLIHLTLQHSVASIKCGA